MEQRRSPSTIDPSVIERPACPRCEMRMMLARISPNGNIEKRSFECPKCDEVVIKTFVADPMQAAIGWVRGELKPPE
jgi:hypothetical protein